MYPGVLYMLLLYFIQGIIASPYSVNMLELQVSIGNWWPLEPWAWVRVRTCASAAPSFMGTLLSGAMEAG